jgi:starch synthase
MDGLLRGRREVLAGILNGIDTVAWNPAADPLIAGRYDASSLERKKANKRALQQRMGLPVDGDLPLFGQVGRLTEQKGSDLVAGAAAELASMGQLVVLGSGDREHERALRGIAAQHPGRIAVQVGFDEQLAHLIEAGADLFLMPSRYEPCGLNQLYSQRYGTLPIVRAVGGLDDTVENEVTGFKFDELSADALAQTVAWAVYVMRNHPEAHREMQRRAMSKPMGWGHASRQYEALYRMAVARRRGGR